MAVAKLLPRHVTPTKTRAQSIAARHDYDANPDKTREGKLASSYMCQPESAAAEFEASKRIYEAVTGKSQPKERDVIMYRIMQSFKPGEIMPEMANKVGYELAMEFTGGNHQFVVYTHEDKAHIHNHIEFNSTNLSCDGKFENVKDSVKLLRQMNDRICLSHGLSIPTPKRKRSLTDKEMGASLHGDSFKKRLKQAIDEALTGCKDFDDFLSRMRKAGYEVKYRGKSLEFLAPGQIRFTRSFRLGEEYTLDALKQRAGGIRQKEERTANGQAIYKKKPGRRKVNLLVDIQAKLQAGKGEGYARWAKSFNLKEASRTLNFLTENGITDYEELAGRAEEAGKKFDALSAKVKQLEKRMADTAQMKYHIINYAKTREVYRAYRKAKNKAEFLAEHEDEIRKHEEAKAAFDRLGGKPIPKVAELSKEYAALLAEKKKCYEEYKAARAEMIDYQNARQNIDRILGLDVQEEKEREAADREKKRKRETESL